MGLTYVGVIHVDGGVVIHAMELIPLKDMGLGSLLCVSLGRGGGRLRKPHSRYAHKCLNDITVLGLQDTQGPNMYS
jgi:hypothetical protein